jgi:hypothetical protein
MVCGLACLAAMLIASMASASLNFQQRHVVTQQLGLLADSTTASLLAAMLNDATYGTHGETLRQAPDKNTTLFASFDTAQASGLGVDVSINNLKNNVSVTVASQTVAAHLATVTVCAQRGSTTHLVDSVLSLPYYSVAVGTAGQLQASGGLTVASYPTVPNLKTLDPALLLPADMASNSPGANAIVLNGTALITGDLQAEGGIQLDAQGRTHVRGAVRANAAAATLPKIDASHYDPGPIAFAPTALAPSPSVPGPVRMMGPVNVQGPLQLDNGLLYVDGDVSLADGVVGTGAVVATGKVSLAGASQLQTTSQVAVVANGDVSIASGSFQGLLYSGGQMSASHVDLFGSFISSSPAGMNFDAVNAVHVPNTPPLLLPGEAVVGGRADWLNHTYTVDPNFSMNADVGAYDQLGNRVPIGALVNYGNQNGYNNLTPMSATYQGVSYPNLITSWCIIAQRGASGQLLYDCRGWTCDQNHIYVGAADTGFMDWAALSHYISVTTPAPPWGFAPTDVTAALASIKTSLDQQMTAATPPIASISLDFNDFIAPGDRIRLLLWHSR